MSEYYVGEIRLTAFNFAPANWLLCNGAVLSISNSQYQALYSVIGTIYGGDGITTFAIPNLNGRGLIGSASAYPIGMKSGLPYAMLYPSNMQAHTHTATFALQRAPLAAASLSVNDSQGSQPGPENAYLAPSMRGTTAINTYGPAATGTATLGGVVSEGSMSGQVDVGAVGVPNPAPMGTLPPVTYLSYMICYMGLFPVRA